MIRLQIRKIQDHDFAINPLSRLGNIILNYN